jgi:CPA1 family monovalent cation:H+ antiporter
VTGLQARALLADSSSYSTSVLAISAAVVCAVVIVARFVWMYPATYVPRWIFPRLARRDPSPPWQWPFALAFTGIRGIVSLAAALAIPFVTERGEPFPHRDLILVLTFAVILVTLVGQGLLLPAVIRALGLANAGRQEHAAERRQEFAARRTAIEAAQQRLETLCKERHLPMDIELLLLAAERDAINELYRNGKLKGEPRRRIERALDLRDAHIHGLKDDE